MYPGDGTETPTSLRIRRRRLLASSVGLGLGTAGCLGGLLGGDSDTSTQTSTATEQPSFDPIDLVTVVPSGVTGLASLNTSALDDTDYESFISAVERVEVSDIDIARTVRTVETRTGIDLSQTDEVLCHGTVTDEHALVPDTVLLDTTRPVRQVITGLEQRLGIEYTVTSYANEPVLFHPTTSQTTTTSHSEPTATDTAATETDASRMSSADPVLAGILGDTQVAIGRHDTVTASLAIRFGDADPLVGPVRSHFEAIRGADLALVSVPTGPLVPEQYQSFVPEINPSDIETIARSYTRPTDGDGLTIHVRVAASDTTTAEDVATAVRGLVGLLRETADETARSALETVTISRDDRIVTLDYEGPTEHLSVLLERI